MISRLLLPSFSQDLLLSLASGKPEIIIDVHMHRIHYTIIPDVAIELVSIDSHVLTFAKVDVEKGGLSSNYLGMCSWGDRSERS